MTAATEVAPVVKNVEVALPPEDAFAFFTERIAEWFPFKTHSIGEDQVETVILEPGTGGRILERWRDGTEYDWATFTAWDPPRRFVMDWRPNPDPGPTTEIEVVFSPSDTGTLVELTHRGWERLGAAAAEMRADYDTGWTLVLGNYTQSVG